MAEIWHLNFEKIKESEDICFTNNLEKFIKKNIPLKNGLIIDATSNKVLSNIRDFLFILLAKEKIFVFLIKNLIM
jgi:tRNA U34 2-thiouridine synthase MnmA/TrmU